MTARGRIVAVLAACFAAGAAWGEFRFPMPEFESGYKYPEMHTPAADLTWAVADVAILVGFLCLAAWLVLKRRSRPGVLALTVVSLLYFGFWRKGCVCPVGSVQNVLDGALHSSVAVPWVVVLFFVLPILFALFFGRVFCAAVCPLGAIQELVAVKPVQLSRPVIAALSVIPYAYLGLAVLGVATGSGYLICEYDPFVGFFRFGASFNMFLVGGLLLLLGVFVGRPYCRFLCPYGVLLGWASRISKWHASIPPTKCIQCRLCESACPYGAIVTPTPEERPESRAQGARRLAWLIALAPVVIALGVGVGVLSSPMLSRLHATVRLAERVALEERGDVQGTTIDTDAFRAQKRTPAELYAEAHDIQGEYKWGAGLLGAFLGIVVIAKLLALSAVPARKDYETHRTHCLSCARCFPYCPVEGDHGA
ncbi:MAG: 4Fe-4S binding protein [FCB group bacterium]|jgi:ferredoxin|nr:4Fe-4S binding protein [FCB group bacterium]